MLRIVVVMPMLSLFAYRRIVVILPVLALVVFGPIWAFCSYFPYCSLRHIVVYACVGTL